MYKEDLALNNLQWLISHKTKPGYVISLSIFNFFIRTISYRMERKKLF